MPVLLTFLYDLCVHTGDLASGPAMRLAISEKILSGQLPYVQFFSLDTPWLLYLSCLPARVNEILAGMHLMQPLVPMTKIIFFLLTLVSLLLSLCMLARRVRENPADAELRLLLYSLPLAILLGNYFVRFQLGEAQHLFAIFLLPYLLARWLSYRDEKSAAESPVVLICAGILCALFTSGDFLFYIVIAMTELALALAFGKVVGDRALGAFALLTVILWGTAFFWPKEVQEAFTRWIVPLRFAKLLAYDEALSSINCAPDNRFTLCFFALTTVLAVLLKDKVKLLGLLAALSALGIFAYALECEGFSSGLVLANFICVLVLVVSLLYLVLKGFESAGLAKNIPAVILLTVSLSASYFFFQKSQSAIDTALGLPVNIRKNGLPDLQEILNSMSAAGDNVLVLCDFANASYPSLIYYDRKQYGFCTYGKPIHLFRLLAQTGRLSPALQEYQKLIREKLQADIESGKAKVIFVHANHEIEDIALDGLMRSLDSRYMLAGRAYYYNQRVEPRESAGGNLPFDYYVLR